MMQFGMQNNSAGLTSSSIYFDFIFLDGPKAQYEYMLDNLIKLLKPNGTLLADNVGFRGYTNGENTPPTKRFKTIIN